MKFRMMLSALLLAAGIVFVTGCGDKSGGASSGSGKSGDSKDTPSTVVKKFFTAFNKHDFDTALKLCDGEIKEFVEYQAKKYERKKKAAAESAEAAQQLKDDLEEEKFPKFEIGEEKIDDGTAVVYCSWLSWSGDKRDKAKVTLKKVDGQWKMAEWKDIKD